MQQNVNVKSKKIKIQKSNVQMRSSIGEEKTSNSDLKIKKINIKKTNKFKYVTKERKKRATVI